MKILIPTDFSRNAFKAFEYAAEMFKWAEPELIMVNVQNARHAGSVMSIDINQDLMIEGKKKMKKELNVTSRTYPDLKIRGIVTAGTFTDSIIEMIEENEIDLVIAGTKGATGAKEVLFGSNASALVQYLVKPLIVVPENWIIEKPDRVLLAADFVETPNKESYDVLLDICYNFKSKLDIFHVKSADAPSFTETSIPFTVEGLEYELNEYESNEIEQSILDHAHKNDIKLIASVKTKGNFIYNLFHRSLTKKLSMHSDTPILILR